MDKMKGFVVGLCTMVELGCLAGLAGIALKRNKDAYDAEMELCGTELKLLSAELDNWSKDRKIKELEKQVEELKGEN